MWTPSTQRPCPSLSRLTASSKSLEDAPSMVMMVLSRRSSRPSRASGGTDWGTARAWSSTSGGKSRRMPWPYRMAATALSRLPAGPKSSRRVPMGGRSPPPKLVMATAPRWPAAPAGRLVSTRMGGSLSLSGRSHSSRPCCLQHPGHRLVGPLQDPDDPGGAARPSPGPPPRGRAAPGPRPRRSPGPWGARTSRPAGPCRPRGVKKPKPRLVAW